MELLLFAMAAAGTLLGAVMMVTQRNPIASALWLVVSFLGVAALYLLQEAQFVAALQVVVYAGAIMVLFLFVIMLLNLRDAPVFARRLEWQKFAAVPVAVVLLAEICCVVAQQMGKSAPLAGNGRLVGSTHIIGLTMFTHYIVPFELTSVILLVAMIGVVVLGKRRI